LIDPLQGEACIWAADYSDWSRLFFVALCRGNEASDLLAWAAWEGSACVSRPGEQTGAARRIVSQVKKEPLVCGSALGKLTFIVARKRTIQS
jgi:hypothetical protein